MTVAAGSEADPDEQDRALVAAHLAGDPQAFADLVGRHRDRLWAVALRTTGHREDAADALQEALIAAYRGFGSFRGESRVTTWLHRIVVNASLDRLRRRQARPTAVLPEQGPGEPAEPRDRMAELDLSVDVQRALAGLPPEQRAALVLVDIEGLPVEEAARVLQVPEGTIKSRCSRGRARLALSLGHLRNPGRPPGVPPAGPQRTVPEGEPS